MLRSDPIGTEITEYINLKISLIDYPSSTPAFFNLAVVYRECKVENLIAPHISEQLFVVGVSYPMVINFDFN